MPFVAGDTIVHKAIFFRQFSIISSADICCNYLYHVQLSIYNEVCHQHDAFCMF